MVAPAGCGKTQVIALAVAEHTIGRQLVLTHTHAGVEALRRRLRTLGAPVGKYNVQTIAGWALGLVSAFPKLGGHESGIPYSSTEYEAVYAGAASLVRMRPIEEILRASYSGVFVDEYQDCDIVQHSLVVGLSETLPCRVVGDPLQAIFGFGGTEIVEWARDVEPIFEPTRGPTTPYRWRKANPELGEWLSEVREKFERGEAVDLAEGPGVWHPAARGPRMASLQVAACHKAADHEDETVVGIHHWERQCLALAKKLRGRYSYIEPLATKDLQECADEFETRLGFQRSAAVLEFAGKCMTKASSALRPVLAALVEGRRPRSKRYAAQLEALQAVASTETLEAVIPALDALSQVKDAVVYRRELLSEMKKAIRARLAGEAESLRQAAVQVRNRTRQLGRRLPRCVIGRTLMVKGLEFDRAVLLTSDGFDRENLYVALTRGARSLRVVSNEQILHPTVSAGGSPS
jgi:DNA helicase-2/ATP-dependent DNA helicase PcrA